MTTRPIDELAGEDGEVERPHRVSKWEIPGELSLETIAAMPHLRWRRFRRGDPRRSVTRIESPNGHDLLRRFLALMRGTPDDVLAFAQRFGVLKICERWYPDEHDAHGYGCLLDEEHYESLYVWVERIQQFEAMLKVAASLYHGRTVPQDESVWRLVECLSVPSTLDLARQAMFITLERWLSYYPVRVFPRWNTQNHAPGLALTPRGLAGALMLQVASAATRAMPMTFCSECGEWFQPTRAPRADERSFCAKCTRLGAPERLAQRDHRARTRKRNEGMPVKRGTEARDRRRRGA